MAATAHNPGVDLRPDTVVSALWPGQATTDTDRASGLGRRA